ncbi:hypothetical protein Tco_0802284 [Tanacetum coccineum]|uniref:Uncharacterized protein n=1 Tax=Tanacetum coccineum TaxID=301880 RepID=A0ABQ5A197_9ASTR
MEKDVQELKQVDHSPTILETIRSQVQAAVDEYLGSSLGDTLQKDEDNLDRVVLNMRKRDREEDEDPSTRSNQGKRKRRSGKDSEPSKKSSASKKTSKGDTPPKSSKTSKSTSAEESVKEATHEVTMGDEEPVQEIMNDADQPQDVVDDQPEQPWFNDLLYAEKDPLTFDELMATPIDLSKFAMNRLKINKLTKAHVVGLVYNLLKGTCQSSIELEYNMEECYKALSDQLDWNNPKGDPCPFDLKKPLSLKGHPGHLTIASEYFFNNELEYLKSSDPENKYTTSITKIKAVRYELVGIEDMIPNLWSVTKVGYDKDVILSMKSVTVNKLHGYGYLEEIMVRRADQQMYKFKEGDFINLQLNDIEDMLLLVVQHKLFHLDGEVIVDLAMALRIFTRSLIIKKRVEDVQVDLSNQKRLIRADELYKFSDGALKKMLERRILRNLERLVGARVLEMDYKLMQRTA